MSFLEALKANLGGLLKVKTQLYWYDQGDWDNNPGRVCLILDAAASHSPRAGASRHVLGRSPLSARSANTLPNPTSDSHAGCELLIDGSPCWIWIDQQDVELLTNEVFDVIS